MRLAFSLSIDTDAPACYIFFAGIRISDLPDAVSDTLQRCFFSGAVMSQTTTKQDERIYVLSQEEPVRAVIRLGVPLIAGMCIMVLYNLVDTYFIGLMHDDYQLAAVNLSYPVMMITIALSNMIGTGASSLIARKLGAGDRETAEHTLTAGFVLTVLNSILTAFFGLLFLNPIVTALGAKANTFTYTADYVSVILAGSLFTMGSYTFGALLRSEGSVKYSVTGMIAGTLTNIILDPLFIFTFGMQIKGAAIATILGNAVGAGCSLYFYLSGKTILRPHRSMIVPTAEILKEIFWVGVPATLETLLTSGAYIVNNNLAVSYGELTVAAMGIAQKILSLGNYIYQGFAAGTQPIMGYNYGARNYRRMIAVLKAGLMTVSLTEFALMAVYGIFAPQLIAVFTISPEVISTGSTVLRAIMLILPCVGATSMSRMSFQAMGKPQFAFVITLIRQLILYIPLLLAFNHLFGFQGMIYAQPVTELIMMAASVTLLVHEIRRAEQQFRP